MLRSLVASTPHAVPDGRLIKIIFDKSGSIILVILLFFLSELTMAQIIPSSRKVTWQGNAGVDGDIPTNYTKYGSTIQTASQGDDRIAIQNALNAASYRQYVLLGAGEFTVAGTITIPDGVVLRGSGVSATTIRQIRSSSQATISFDGGVWSSTDHNLAGGSAKGSTSITTSSPHGWSAGDIILIDQINGGTSYNPPITNLGDQGACGWCGRESGTRTLGQVCKLASASGTSATLEIPLYWDYDPALIPQGVELVNPRRAAGIEDLKIDNSTTMNDNQNETGTIDMAGTANCWVKNVEIYGAKRMGINMARCYRNTIRTVEIHKTLNYASNNGYAIWLRHGASANLIEDCIIHDMASSFILIGPCSGNVFGYNYTTDIQSTTYPMAVRSCWTTHGGHPMMNLVEGLYSDGQHISCDDIWGSASHNTFFRNRILTDPKKTEQQVCIAIYRRHYYNNFVGCVLGTEGREDVYITHSLPFAGDPYCIYYFSRIDNTEQTALIHGNFDYVHDDIVWDAEIQDHDIPKSYYLTDKPLWWGALPWPPIGPDLIPMVNNIPAKLRYEGIDSKTPRPPRNLRIGK